MKTRLTTLLVALAIALPVAVIAPTAASAAPPAASTSSVSTIIRIKAVTGVYRWWVPVCWNLGYGVPGGTRGWCYDG